MPELEVKISNAPMDELREEGRVIVDAMRSLGWMWLGSMTDVGKDGYRELSFSKRANKEAKKDRDETGLSEFEWALPCKCSIVEDK